MILPQNLLALLNGSDDEWDYITERVSSYFEEKGFWPEIEKFGYLEENSDGFDVKIVD